MARPSQKSILKTQCSSIRESKKWRNQENYDDLWRRMINLYKGKHFDGELQEDRIKVNQAFAIKNVMAPAVSINNPKFLVHARQEKFGPQAVFAETVLNYLWRVNGYQAEFRLAVDDFLTIGHGWLKVGFKTPKPKEEERVEDVHDDGFVTDTHGVDEREDVPGNVETENWDDRDEARPFVERISPFDVFVDPDARSLSEMKWIAQRVRRPLADVKVDKRYEAAARKAVTEDDARHRVDDEDRPIDGQPSDNHGVTYVDVYEYYDLRRGEVSTFCLGQEEHFLIKPQKMPYSFGHPFVMLRNYEVPDLFYPMGELEQIEELQFELNETRSQMFNHRKKYARKYLYDKEAFEDEGLQALQSDIDNTLVPVDVAAAHGGQLATAIMSMPQEGTPPEFYNQSQLISNDIDEITGVTDYMRGGASEIRRTATEAAMIQDSMNARAAHKLSAVEHCLSELGKRVLKLMQQYMTGTQVATITGGPVPVWVDYTPEHIQGEFDFEVQGGSTQPRNESFRRQSALQLMDAMAPFIELGVVDPVALAIHVLRDGFDVKDPSKILAQQARPAGPGQQAPPQGPPPGPPGMPPGMPPQGGMGAAPQAGPPGPVVPPELQALMGQAG